MKENTCAVIVTFHPDEKLISSIEILKEQVGKIIIVDNHSNYRGQIILEKCKSICNLELIKNKINFGIAAALNQGINYASDLGYEWALTLDQDTIPFRNIIKIISAVYYEYPKKEVIGGIGVSYVEIEDLNSVQNTMHLYLEKDFLITSGCLTSISAFKKVGGFRDDLFIDHVDDEFSLRLKKNGYTSLLTVNPGMIHEIGFPKKITLLGFTLSSSNHNAQRKFYKARNQIILIKEYILIFPYFILKSAFFFMLDIFGTLLLENDRVLKLKLTLKGIYSGLFYKNPNRN